jgi:putative transposase
METEDPSRYPRRKRIRLPAECYDRTCSVCSVTIATLDRRPVFASRDIAQASVGILRDRSERKAVPVYAYCIMPDHAHLLLSPSADCDIPTFVGEYKNLTQRAAWALGAQGAFWQRRYWDHFLRAEERMNPVVHYILDNPVRKGLVTTREQYPFSGSFVFEPR